MIRIWIDQDVRQDEIERGYWTGDGWDQDADAAKIIRTKEELAAEVVLATAAVKLQSLVKRMARGTVQLAGEEGDLWANSTYLVLDLQGPLL